MADRITANLPSADFDRTEAFFAKLGFVRGYRDDGWMILAKGTALEVEFFPMPVDPRSSWFSACLRLDDLDGFHAICRAAEIPTAEDQFPRLSEITVEGGVVRLFYLLDPDGSLIRCIDEAYQP
ncbi:bleomycin resistance protein [Parvularcula sp. LCG005]|uniref:bleomycin resistance protein n=1 Tax=Parvularcula sp. LCG005 TaxID=3078805 RepID=UPI00294267FA|nr:bleomycin resistance protein [Parvularcula sp. LCG005]WOI54828.1 bleomycin resistance protein [Parvularcula sp. LCG005]